MAVRPILAFAVAALLALPLRAADTVPPMAGLSAPAAKERAGLFAALAATRSDAEARAVEDRLWRFWRGLGDAASLALLKKAEDAQLEFDYGHAIEALQAMVAHQPDFAEGWNRLAYALFLANSYDAALAALDKAIALEPMHYAALAGRGVILIRQGNDPDGVAALKRALAIDPWLKERNLIANPSAIRN
ncbi:MAG TPA: tetratricopeptide repeat protein [Pseudolabrys sp.]|nr:tetratricopeptide repeat protein [Pseudolabrys sp.]